MPIIGMFQRKGGAGKTTIAANLAGELLQAGHPVLVIDLDSGETLTKWAKTRAPGGLLRTRVKTRQVDAATHRGFVADLEALLLDVEYLLLDSPGVIDAGALSAAMVADLALVPVGPNPNDIDLARETVEFLRHMQRQRAGKPSIAFVPSRLAHDSWSRALPSSLLAFGEQVLPAIRSRKVHDHAMARGQTVREYRNGAKASIQEFEALTEAVLRIIRGETHGQARDNSHQLREGRRP